MTRPLYVMDIVRGALTRREGIPGEEVFRIVWPGGIGPGRWRTERSLIVLASVADVVRVETRVVR